MRTAYFRGRKLHGKTVVIPKGNRGVLVQRQESAVSNEAENPEDDQPDGPDDAQEGKLQITGEFRDMTVWGHESVADSASDCHIRGMEEWMEVSKKVRQHSLWLLTSPGPRVNHSSDPFVHTGGERGKAVIGAAGLGG